MVSGGFTASPTLAPPPPNYHPAAKQACTTATPPPINTYLYSQKNSFLQPLYSGGKGLKYQVCISCCPSWITSMFFTCDGGDGNQQRGQQREGRGGIGFVGLRGGAAVDGVVVGGSCAGDRPACCEVDAANDPAAILNLPPSLLLLPHAAAYYCCPENVLLHCHQAYPGKPKAHRACMRNVSTLSFSTFQHALATRPCICKLPALLTDNHTYIPYVFSLAKHVCTPSARKREHPQPL